MRLTSEREKEISSHLNHGYCLVSFCEELFSEIYALRKDLALKPYKVKCTSCDCEYANDAGLVLEEERDELRAALEVAQNWAQDAVNLLAGAQISHRFNGDENVWCNRILRPWNNAKGRIEALK